MEGEGVGAMGDPGKREPDDRIRKREWAGMPSANGSLSRVLKWPRSQQKCYNISSRFNATEEMTNLQGKAAGSPKAFERVADALE